MKKAFTMAEVLLTLGVIGVVASLTIPQLISNYRKMLVENRLKTTVNIISNALKMAEVDYGDSKYWVGDYSSDAKNDEYIKKYILNYLKLKNVDKRLLSTNYNKYKLNNGTSFGVKTWKYGDGLWFYINLNINKKTKNGIDLFGVFYDSRNKYLTSTKFRGNLLPISDREKYKKYCTKGFTNAGFLDDGKGRGQIYCFWLIETNGWRIPNDYPINF